MGTKKSKKADLSKKTGFFFSIGLVLALAFVITGFEWKSYDKAALVIVSEGPPEDIWLPPVTKIEKPKPPKIANPDKIVETKQEVVEPEKIIFEVPEDSVIIYVEPGPIDIEEKDPDVFLVVEDPAKPEGGYVAFYTFVKKRLKYPRSAKRLGVEGKVFVQFVVDTKGNLTEVEVIKGIGAGCDEEAIRVVKKSPTWNPAKQRGVPVNQRIVIPITFKLN